MSVKCREALAKFCERDDLIYEKEFLSEEENDKVSEVFIIGDIEVKDEILKKYDYDYDDRTFRYRFYKSVPSGITEEQINQYIAIKTLENLRDISGNINTIRYIMQFWFILSLLSLGIFLIGIFITASR